MYINRILQVDVSKLNDKAQKKKTCTWIYIPTKNHHQATKHVHHPESEGPETYSIQKGVCLILQTANYPVLKRTPPNLTMQKKQCTTKQQL